MVGAEVALTQTSKQSLPDGASLLLDFTSGLAIKDGTITSIDALLDCQRIGTSAILDDNGEFIHFDANELRRSKRGLLIEETRTNYLLNSFSPANQTVALDAGDYVLSVVGSGSATLSGDAAGVATQGNNASFSLAVAGSVIVTTAGLLSAFQLEKGSFSTSPIQTYSSSVTRQVDTVSFIDADWLDPQNCTLLIEWEQVAPGVGTQNLIRWSNNVNWSRIRSGSGVIAQVQNASSVLILNSGNFSSPPLGTNRIITALFPDDMAVAWKLSNNMSGISTDQVGTPNAPPNIIFLGSNGIGEVMNGWIKKITYWPQRLVDAELTQLILE